MTDDLFISRRKEVHSAGHSVYRPAKENAFLLFILIFLIPKLKELIGLVIKQSINTGVLFQSTTVKVIEFILLDPEKHFTSILARLALLPYF